MKVFHWSAVNPENPSPVAILFGILLISDGTFILLVHSCMISKCFVVNRFSSIHNRVTIHLAIPKNRQCIGSTIRNFVGSKYGSRYISDYLRDMIFSCIFGITFLPYICIISYFISISLYKPLTHIIKSTKI